MKKVGKVVLIAFIALIVLGALSSACSKSSSTSTSSAATQSASSSTLESSEAVAGDAGGSSLSSAAKEEMNGFDPKTNYVVTVAGVEFQIPSYYEKGKTSTSDGGTISTTYSALSGKDAGVVIISFEQSIPNGTSANFEKIKADAVETLAGMHSSVENVSVTNSEDAEIAGMSGMVFSAVGSTKGVPIDEHGVVYWNDALKCLGGFLYYEIGDLEHDYYSDFEKTIASARTVEAPSSKSAENTGTSEQVRQNDSGEVSPDLKEMLDSYEAFMDEYVEFMKTYQESDDTMGMLSKYSEYMQKYLDFAQKVEAVDTSNMSAADYAYYIEVTSRVSQKLLTVSGI
ncbi:MAG: hypothetical protein IJH88_01785 [Eggerthellaceae bacterium]|nr:hypothetical protein [Eggerthellaceae bacterium]